MKLTFLGHSAIQLVTEDAEILIDPFLTGNPMAPIGPEDVDPTHIILTHAHGDHVGDTESIAKRSGATVISSFEIVTYLSAKGLDGFAMNPGGPHDFAFGTVSFTPAWHSNSFPDGTYGGMPMGVVVEAGDKRIYHAGDTALFSDMSLIGRKGLDMAFLPIGSNFTMGPQDALEAVRLLRPARVVPIHYNTFDVIQQDPQAFRREVESQTTSKCLVLAPGEALEL